MLYCKGTVTEEDIKETLVFFKVPKSTPYKPFWLIDCFRDRIHPELCDPLGCGKCSHFKELEELYNGRSN